MLWQAVSCSLFVLWSVGFLQILVVVFRNLPLWRSLTWQLNFPSSQFSFIVEPLWTTERKEHRHQSLWLTVDYCQSVQEHSSTWGRKLVSWQFLRGNRFNLIFILFLICVHIFISLHKTINVPVQWRNESAKKPDSSDQHRAAAEDILYMRSLCIAQNVECSLCVDQSDFPWTISVLSLLQFVDLCGWWECGGRGWRGGAEHVSHPLAFIIDDNEVSKWLRNKAEMEAEEGVVIWEQEKINCWECLFSICSSFSLCCDGQALKQAGAPARWQHLGEEGNRKQRVTKN